MATGNKIQGKLPLKNGQSGLKPLQNDNLFFHATRGFYSDGELLLGIASLLIRKITLKCRR